MPTEHSHTPEMTNAGRARRIRADEQHPPMGTSGTNKRDQLRLKKGSCSAAAALLAFLLCLPGCGSEVIKVDPQPRDPTTKTPTPAPKHPGEPKPTSAPSLATQGKYKVRIGIPSSLPDYWCAIDVDIAKPEAWGCFTSVEGVRDNLLKEGWVEKEDYYYNDEHTCTTSQRWPC